VVNNLTLLPDYTYKLVSYECSTYGELSERRVKYSINEGEWNVVQDRFSDTGLIFYRIELAGSHKELVLSRENPNPIISTLGYQRMSPSHIARDEYPLGTYCPNSQLDQLYNLPQIN